MSNEREKVIERAALVVARRFDSRVVGDSVATDLYDAGLLSTQDHIDALAACERMTRPDPEHSKGELDAICVGQRSLAAKAAAQESPLARVKELEKWLKHIAKLPCIQSYLKESRPCARYECAPCIAMRAMSTLSKSASFGEDE